MTSAYQLDTSGEVWLPSQEPREAFRGGMRWQDLTPFTQGYVEALLKSANEALAKAVGAKPGSLYGFSDLAPETLERIIADCERAAPLFTPPNSANGAWFWAHRQSKGVHGFPPLTVTLNDAGKVVFQ